MHVCRQLAEQVCCLPLCQEPCYHRPAAACAVLLLPLLLGGTRAAERAQVQARDPAWPRLGRERAAKEGPVAVQPICSSCCLDGRCCGAWLQGVNLTTCSRRPCAGQLLLPLLQCRCCQQLLLVLVLDVQVQGLVVLLLHPDGLLCLCQLSCICCYVDVEVEPLGARLAALQAGLQAAVKTCRCCGRVEAYHRGSSILPLPLNA